MSDKIAIIGGSGVYDLFKKASKISVKTPYGKVETIKKTKYKEREIFFLPRHGPKHSVPPHLINYKANIFALHSLGVKKIYATNAVGSIDISIKPGDFVVPDQIIDMTKVRPLTFFDGSTTIKFEDGSSRKGVVHLDYTEPYCINLRNMYIKAVEDIGEMVYTKGVYVCSEGPRFETSAEIIMYQKMGGTLAGMTTVPEAILARELKMCYSTLCLITNFGAGMQEKITHEEVVEIFEQKTNQVKEVMKKIISSEHSSVKCNCIS
ncbi:MAG: S-methyl-5'-thioadenosine phosphorylase [Candidatus Heimdallarchaeota archaeon]|nr:S-methyl-5'-thioadenosine phosphorylase [Candidatus Heimdallarchaeota archaeon]